MRPVAISNVLSAFALTALLLAGCGDKKGAPAKTSSPSGGGAVLAGMEDAEHGEADTRPIPKGRAEILAALDASLAEGKANIDGGKLGDLHHVADRIEKLAGALATAGGRPGKLGELSKALDEQGDAGNASGSREVLASIAIEIAAAKK